MLHHSSQDAQPASAFVPPVSGLVTGLAIRHDLTVVIDDHKDFVSKSKALLLIVATEEFNIRRRQITNERKVGKLARAFDNRRQEILDANAGDISRLLVEHCVEGGVF